MQNILEVISFCLMGVLCFLCSKSDLRDGIIHNKILAVFLGCAIALDAVYYGFFVKDLFRDFALNISVITAVSLYFFYSHSFAGGDCKLIIVLAMLYPARYYLMYGSSRTTLLFAVGLAILAGYCYLFCSSIGAILSKKVTITKEYIKSSLWQFLKSYFAAMLYISCVNNMLLLFGNQGFHVNVWFIRGSCLVVAWCVGRFPVLKKLKSLVLAGIIAAVSSLVVKSIPFSLNPENYLLTLILLICQMTIRTNLYEKIPVSELKKGMILSTFSSLLMQSSITKRLPAVSTEDLKSRLTTEEIESVQIWARATHTENLVVVKKISFAVFISIGFLGYCISGSIFA